MKIALVLRNSFLPVSGVHDFVLSTQWPLNLWWQKLSSKLVQLEDSHSSWSLGYWMLDQMYQLFTHLSLYSFFSSLYWKGARMLEDIYLCGCLQGVSLWLTSALLLRATNTGCCSNVTNGMNSWVEHFHFFWAICPLHTTAVRQKDHKGWGYEPVPGRNVGKLSYQEQSCQMSSVSCRYSGKVLKRH